MKPPKQSQAGDASFSDRQAQMGQRAPDPVRPGCTAAQLRHDIDSGLTGDKVNFFDPAAAPLGTDEEAGGFPPTPEEIYQARMTERSPPYAAPGADERTPGGMEYGSVYNNEEDVWTEQPDGKVARWIGYLVVAAAIAILVFMLASS